MPGRFENEDDRDRDRYDDRDDDRGRGRDDDRGRGRDDDRDRRRGRDDRDYDRGGYAPPPSNAAGLVLGIIGLVIGTLSLILSFVPCVGALALWPGILASVISLVGVFLSVRNKAVPIVALVLSLGSVGLAIRERERVKEVVKDVKEGVEDVGKKLEKERQEAERREKERKEQEEKDRKAKEEAEKKKNKMKNPM